MNYFSSASDTFDKKLATSLMLLVCFPLITQSLVAIFNAMKFTALNALSPAFNLIIFLLAFLLALKPLLTRSFVLTLVAVCAFSLLICVTLFFHPGYTFLFATSEFLQTIILGLLPFLIVISVRDFDIFLEGLLRFVPALFAMCILVYLGVFAVSEDTYSQLLAYQMAFISLLLLVQMSQRFNASNLVMYVVLGLLILSSGSRAPLLVYMAGLILSVLYKLCSKVFWIKLKTDRMARMSAIVICAGLAICALFSKQVIQLMLLVMTRLGLSGSRSIALLDAGRFLFVSDRLPLYDQMLMALNKTPLDGLGFFGDRAVLGGYVHNIGIEMLVHYGYVLGLVLLLGLIALCVHLLCFQKDKTLRLLVLVFFPISILMLLVSGSYATNTYFAALVALGFKSLAAYFWQPSAQKYGLS